LFNTDIRDEFKQCLNELVPMLLAPENILLKKINGVEINVAQFVEYLQLYVKNLNNAPTPGNIFDVCAEF